MAKRGICLILICVGSVFALNADEVIDKTAKKYEKMNSFYSEFTQIFCDEASGTCQEFTGKIFFLRPNFFRMEVDTPAQIYVGDSISLWIYFPKKNRAIKQTLKEVPFAVNPEIFLKDYQKNFNYEIAEDKENFLLSLFPKDETQVYQKILVKINKKKLTIQEFAINNGAGSESKFTFKNPQLNQKVPKKLFRFNPPKGCKVIEQ